jgi:hypothetical protein
LDIEGYLEFGIWNFLSFLSFFHLDFSFFRMVDF